MSDTTTTAAEPLRLLYTPAEAAGALGISRSSLYVLLAQGAIRSVRIGGSRRVPATDLHDFVAGLQEDAWSSDAGHRMRPSSRSPGRPGAAAAHLQPGRAQWP